MSHVFIKMLEYILNWCFIYISFSSIRFSVVLDMNPYMDTSMSNCQTENGNEGQEHSVNMDLLKPTVDADVTRTAHSRPSVELTVQNGNQSDFVSVLFHDRVWIFKKITLLTKSFLNVGCSS